MELHVAYSSDDNYARHVGASMISLFENNKEFDEIYTHILNNGIKKESQDKLNKIVKDYNRKIKYYDFSNVGDRLTIEVPKTIAISAYNRLFLSSAIDESIDKIIYMDCDSIITGCFMNLWNEDISDYFIAGVLDNAAPITKTKVGLDINSPYVNSGFLFINLKKWRETNAERLIIDFIVNHKGNVHHHDQGVINGMFNNKIKILNPRYNLMTTFFDMTIKEIVKMYDVNPYYTQSEIDYAKQNPVFVHFTPAFSNRPWMEKCKHPLKETYLKYLNMTEWRETPLEKDSRKYTVKLIDWMFNNLPFNIFYFLWKRL